jgi:hypothetical protein
MRGDARKAGGRQGRYLRIPSWASLRCRKLPTPDPFASSVSIELEKHRPIPVDEPIVPEAPRGGPAADGVLFEGVEPLSPGTILEIQISFPPDDATITLRGEVVDSEASEIERGSYRIRAGFIAGSDAEVDVIARFVKKFYG